MNKTITLLIGLLIVLWISLAVLIGAVRSSIKERGIKGIVIEIWEGDDGN